MTTLKHSTLANAFAVIADDEHSMESKADGVLRIVRMAGLRDLPAFNAAVKVAYAENGWNAAVGKPKPGNRAKLVPVTVKQYVSTVRAAMRAEIDIGKMTTFHALRKALSHYRSEKRKIAKPEDFRIEGLHLVKPREMTGAPFHDLVVTYDRLGKRDQAQLAAQVTRLVREYRAALVEPLRLAA